MAIRTTPGPEFFLQRQPLILALAERFDDLTNPAIITDADANIIWTNRAILERTGFTREEALGRNPAALWGGQMPKEFYEWMWHTIKDEKRVFVNKLLNRDKAGTSYWQYIYVAPILDAEGAIKYFVAFEFDADDPAQADMFITKLEPALDAQQHDPAAALEAFLTLLKGGEHPDVDIGRLSDLIRDVVASAQQPRS